jgi:type VI secretion system secreted protein VgrG
MYLHNNLDRCTAIRKAHVKYNHKSFAAWRCLVPVVAFVACSSTTGYAGTLDAIGRYGVFANLSLTNTGVTNITGDIGLYPGASITGFSAGGDTGSYTGVADLNNSASEQAATNLLNIYTSLSNLSPITDLTGSDLGAMTLTSGVYNFDSTASLTGTLTLDAANNPNARFVFIIGSTLTTGADSKIRIINTSLAREGADCGIYWVLGSSAVIGEGTDFEGNILAKTSITLNTGASIDHGRALSINGSVTLSGNTIDASDVSGGFGVAVPEPATYALFGSSCALGFAMLARRRRK